MNNSHMDVDDKFQDNELKTQAVEMMNTSAQTSKIILIFLTVRRSLKIIIINSKFEHLFFCDIISRISSHF